MRPAYKNLLKRYSFYLGGDQPHVPWMERIRSVIGAFIGLMLVLTTAKFLGELSGLDEWLMASMGARISLSYICLERICSRVMPKSELSLIMEVNPRHALIQRLATVRETDAEAAGLVAEQMLDNALLAAGLLDDPQSLIGRTQRIMERLLAKA